MRFHEELFPPAPGDTPLTRCVPRAVCVHQDPGKNYCRLVGLMCLERFLGDYDYNHALGGFCPGANAIAHNALFLVTTRRRTLRASFLSVRYMKGGDLRCPRQTGSPV